MKLCTLFTVSALFTALAMPMTASALDVNIAADLPSVDVMHSGQMATIMRNQNRTATSARPLPRPRANARRSVFSLLCWLPV
jgi:hypothetical protein